MSKMIATGEEALRAHRRARRFYGPGRFCYPCPTCKEPNRLTRRMYAKGYQCDQCADREEGLWPAGG